VLGEGVVDGENTFEQLGAVHVVHGGSGVLALEEGDEPEGAAGSRSYRAGTRGKRAPLQGRW
jgi:hypothetical protein